MERRQFTREFKLEAVRLIKQRGVSYAQASKDLGVHPTQLRNWVKQLADDPQHEVAMQFCSKACDAVFPSSGAAKKIEAGRDLRSAILPPAAEVVSPSGFPRLIEVPPSSSTMNDIGIGFTVRAFDALEQGHDP
jgi:transposase-like protein